MYIKRKVLALSFLIGLVITLLTSLLVNNTIIGEFPNLRFVSIPMLGVSYWGYPLPWMKLTIYPGAVKEPIWSHFVVNIVYWTVLVLIIKVLYLRKVKVKEKMIKKPLELPKKRPKKPVRKIATRKTRTRRKRKSTSRRARRARRTGTR